MIAFASTSAACGSVLSGENSATRAAQLERANDLATQIAQSLEITLQASSVQATAMFQELQQVLASASEWPLRDEQAFDSPERVWITGEQANDYGLSSWRLEGGRYLWEVQSNQGLVWWSIPDMEPVADFHLHVRAARVEGSRQSLIGLVFRNKLEEGYYVFQVNPNQQYAVYLNQAGDWQALLPWSSSSAIHPEGDNLLEVIGQGPRFFFFVNSHYVDELVDDRLSEGTTGILVGLDSPDDEGAWEFFDYQLRLPPGAGASSTPTP